MADVSTNTGAVSAVRTEKTSPDAVWHPFADVFPMLEGDNRSSFVEDIRERGVIEPVVMYDGKVLDGRNRYAVAREIGVDIPVVDYLGDDPIGYVVAKNLQRRHLDESQRAMAAGRIANLRRGRPGKAANVPDDVGDIPEFLKRNGTDKATAIAKANKKHPERPAVTSTVTALSRRGKAVAAQPVTQSEAAEMMNVSERSVRTAKQVIEKGEPELVSAVDAGKVTVSAAAKVAKLPPSEQKRIVKEGPAAVKKVAAKARAEEAKPSTRGAVFDPAEFDKVAWCLANDFVAGLKDSNPMAWERYNEAASIFNSAKTLLIGGAAEPRNNKKIGKTN